MTTFQPSDWLLPTYIYPFSHIDSNVTLLFLYYLHLSIYFRYANWGFSPFQSFCSQGGLPGRRSSRREAPPRRRHPRRRHPQKEAPPTKETPRQGDPLEGGTPQAHTQGGKLRVIRSRPTAKGEIEGDQIQAHTQGGNWGGSDPGTPKGEIEGDQIQAHSQGGNWRGSDLGPHPRGKLRGSDPGPHQRGKLRGIRTSPLPPTTTTAAGGTHPTGIHSCFIGSRKLTTWSNKIIFLTVYLTTLWMTEKLMY